MIIIGGIHIIVQILLQSDDNHGTSYTGRFSHVMGNLHVKIKLFLVSSGINCVVMCNEDFQI